VSDAIGRPASGREWVIPEGFLKLLRDAGVRPRRMLELDPGTEESAVAFEHAIATAKEKDTQYGAAVYLYSVQEYKGMRLFLTEDGKAGCAVKPDGDIVSCFSGGGNHMTYIMHLAISQGGWKADSFDTALPHLYAPLGMRA